MPIVRVKRNINCVVHVAALDEMVALTPDMPFDAADPVVAQCPWAFAGEGEQTAKPRRVSASLVEDASARPGKKR